MHNRTQGLSERTGKRNYLVGDKHYNALGEDEGSDKKKHPLVLLLSSIDLFRDAMINDEDFSVFTHALAHGQPFHSDCPMILSESMMSSLIFSFSVMLKNECD